VNGDQIENIYRIQVINTSEHPMSLTLTVLGLENPLIYDVQNKLLEHIDVPASSNILLPLKVRITQGTLPQGPNLIRFIMQGEEVNTANHAIIRRREEKSTFIMLP
jgi:polyferredoxin